MDWARFERESPFARAAQTRRNELLAAGEDQSNIVVQRIDNARALESTWMKLAKLEKVDGLNMYSHGYSRGPEVAGGSKDVWERIITVSLNWSDEAIAVFHGCNTDDFAARFAETQHVTTYGQQGYSSFSSNPVLHVRIFSWSPRVYLYHFEFLNLLNTNWWGVAYTVD
ncbi:MAG: hypothetical protein PHQ21_09035 [Firmicutes bacterium]|nr:hypothetical protein [Bacillota bacterium]